MSRQRPLIGLTLDSEEGGHYSSFPWYAIRQNYMSAVAAAGTAARALAITAGELGGVGFSAYDFATGTAGS